MEGWIKVHRQIRGHWLYDERRTFSKYEAWLDILMDANHQEREFALGNEIIHVERGEYITSEVKLAARWGWSRTKVRSFLEVLEREKMLVRKSDSKKTCLKVHNYAVYQGSENSELDSKKTSKKHKQELKNDKKEYIKDSSSRKTKFSEDHLYFKMAVGFKNLVNGMLKREGINKQINPNLQSWADEFRKLVELDKQEDIDLIRQVMRWVVQDDFWKGNCQSAKTFREKFTKLALKMKQEGKPKTKAQQPNDNTKSERDRMIALQRWVDAGNDPDQFVYDG